MYGFTAFKAHFVVVSTVVAGSIDAKSNHLKPLIGIAIFGAGATSIMVTSSAPL
jgi:hypothetical protein